MLSHRPTVIEIISSSIEITLIMMIFELKQPKFGQIWTIFDK